MMNEALDTALCGDITDHEGVIPWLYCDKKGNVTVGIGHLVCSADAAAKLPFRVPLDKDRIATDEEKRAAWAGVAAAFDKAHTVAEYAGLNGIRLHRADSVALMRDQLNETFLPFCLKLFHSFGQWPLAAQRATLDMVYSLGCFKYAHEYVNHVAALQDARFDVAALECIRVSGKCKPTKDDPEGIGKRNLWTRRMYSDAWAQHNAEVQEC
jgi:GH24 family phage-related lysozyme (muramidase)